MRRTTNGIKTYSRTGIGALLPWVHSAYAHDAELLSLVPTTKTAAIGY
jgi:hypothetical protein